MYCNDTIQFSIDMHFMCKYGRKNEFLPACIFMFIHLIVTLSILNNIESHNAGWVYKQKFVESLWCWIGTNSRTVPRAYLLPCYRESHDIFRVMHKPMCVYKWLYQASDQIMVTWSAPSHYLNQCWYTVNWTPRNNGKWRPFCLGLNVLNQH